MGNNTYSLASKCGKRVVSVAPAAIAAFALVIRAIKRPKPRVLISASTWLAQLNREAPPELHRDKAGYCTLRTKRYRPMPRVYDMMLKRLKNPYELPILLSEASANDFVTAALGEIAASGKGVPIVGFDLEWKPTRKSPVALMQICIRSLNADDTPDFGCVLRVLRAGAITGSLRTMLEDPRILKLGVGIHQDAKRLLRDTGVNMRGWVDLARLVSREKIFCKKSLGGVVQGVLGFDLPKNPDVRCSDWEAEKLNAAQIIYAAADAAVAVDVFESLSQRREAKHNFSADGLLHWVRDIVEKPMQATGQQRKQSTNTSDRKNKILSRQEVERRAARSGRLRSASCRLNTRFVRKRPLYENCKVLHPNGDFMFTCSRRKINFYLEKNLAVVVGEYKSDSPVTIRLTFTPKGRGDAEDPSGRVNQCVVCGAKQGLLRYSVVPYCYRQYFPMAIKSHSSHDIVQLCTMCHTKAGIFAGNLRSKLAVQHGAPLHGIKDAKARSTMDEMNKAVGVARSLAKHGENIRHRAPKRFAELQEIICSALEKYPKKSDDISDEAHLIATQQRLKEAFEKSKATQSHGSLVVDKVSVAKDGLFEFQKMWRRHFVEMLRPKFLSSHWSVEHQKPNDVRVYADGSKGDDFRGC